MIDEQAHATVSGGRWSGLGGIELPFFLQASVVRPVQPQPAPTDGFETLSDCGPRSFDTDRIIPLNGKLIR